MSLADSLAAYNQSAFGTGSSAILGFQGGDPGNTLAVKSVLAVPPKTSTPGIVSTLFDVANQGVQTLTNVATAAAALKSTIKSSVVEVKQAASAEPIKGTPAPQQSPSNTVQMFGAPASTTDLSFWILVGGGILLIALIMGRK